MDSKQVKALILNEGLTVMDVIDALIDLNGLNGVSVVAMGVDLKGYCLYKATDNPLHKSEKLNDLHDFPERRPIRMVVIDEHTLGYTEEGTNFANVLHASILKGATFTTQDGDRIYLKGRKVRTATVKDFEDFRVLANGYLKDPRYIIDP